VVTKVSFWAPTEVADQRTKMGTVPEEQSKSVQLVLRLQGDVIEDVLLARLHPGAAYKGADRERGLIVV
jgi:hypothetical protein